MQYNEEYDGRKNIKYNHVKLSVGEEGWPDTLPLLYAWKENPWSCTWILFYPDFLILWYDPLLRQGNLSFLFNLIISSFNQGDLFKIQSAIQFIYFLPHVWYSSKGIFTTYNFYECSDCEFKVLEYQDINHLRIKFMGHLIFSFSR